MLLRTRVTEQTEPSIRRPEPGTDRTRGLRADHRAAVDSLVGRVRARVRASLHQALVFGSRARGGARPDSDLDVLLVFRALPPDREPQASHAESIAEEVARETGVPVQVWCVSLPDLERGRRTPMLVDALSDAVPVWPPERPVPRPAFTPDDACFCAASLLERVAEGGREVAARAAAGDPGWPRRLRDDVVRLCTALLLLAGETRPRRAGAVRRMLVRERPGLPLSRADRAVLAWAARSYGPGSGDEEAPVPPPPVPLPLAARLVDRLRRRVGARLARLECGRRHSFIGAPPRRG